MSRRLFWSAACLAIALVIIKAGYLGVPGAYDLGDYARSLVAISYGDVLFAGVAWACARAALALVDRRGPLARIVWLGFVAYAAFACLYAVASIIAFRALGGFLTYPLLHLVGNVRMLGSSVGAYLTLRVAIGLVCVPLVYVGVVWAAVRGTPPESGPGWRRSAIACVVFMAWVIVGHYVYTTDWVTHYDWRIAENPPWVLVSSWWRATRGGTVRLAETFTADDLADFAPIGVGRPPRSSSAPPLNVIVVVLESVAARWTGISTGAYDSTPNLKAESASGITFDSFYSHVGRSSNALAAMLLSVYPKLGFRDFTEEFPSATTTPLAAVFRGRGYRTAFITASDTSWAGWRSFIEARGFDEVRDQGDLPCETSVSSWGVEDRCLVDGLIQFIDRDPTHPFFVMAWTQQTHHPYEPSPGVPMLDLVREPAVPDAYDLGRYLNVLHETDAELARLFETVRRAGLSDDTLIVVVGDHGQAFGYPHDSYLQGRTVYEEDVHVPLLLWLPRLYKMAAHSRVVGGQVDLAPTIVELAGLPAAPDWQGRSLFDPQRASRAYFYVTQDEFKLGVRDGTWKYMFDLRAGAEELYDLEDDPTEQRNRARTEPERCARMRQRLAAWTEANRRQYVPSQ